MKFLSLQVLLVCVCPSILSFRLSQIARFQSSKLYSSNNQDQQKQVSSSILSNNKYFSKVIASTLGLILTIASPAYAFGELESANNKLSTYGLPPILFVPPNFTPIVSEYGRGSAKEQMTNPVVVEFSHPSLWVTASTTVNNNGESGTISANDYIKGDSSFFFTLPEESSKPLDKSTVGKFILKSLSQKGDPVDSFKVLSARTQIDPVTQREYLLADISYSLNTQAGFVIDRKGIVSVTSVGSFNQGLISVTTTKRWAGLEATIRDIASSFRVYPLKSGIFSGSSEGK